MTTTSTKATARRIAAGALVVLALGAPVATAKPIVDPPRAAPSQADLSAHDAAPATDGFAWGPAGAVSGFVLLTLAGLSAARHARVRVTR